MSARILEARAPTLPGVPAKDTRSSSLSLKNTRFPGCAERLFRIVAARTILFGTLGSATNLCGMMTRDSSETSLGAGGGGGGGGRGWVVACGEGTVEVSPTSRAGFFSCWSTSISLAGSPFVTTTVSLPASPFTPIVVGGCCCCCSCCAGRVATGGGGGCRWRGADSSFGGSIVSVLLKKRQ